MKIYIDGLLKADEIETDETKICPNGGSYCHSHRYWLRKVIHDLHCAKVGCEYARPEYPKVLNIINPFRWYNGAKRYNKQT